MSLSYLPDDKIYEICENMDLQTLSRFIQTSQRIYGLCSDLIVNKYIEKNFPYYTVNDVLSELDDILSANEGDPELDYVFPLLVNNPKAKITPKLFAEAFKQNLKNTVKAILLSGKLDPNNPEIFDNIKADEVYSIGHELIETIVEDPRILPDSKQFYEWMFLLSYPARQKGIDQKQFREFNLYKYGFSPELIRDLSSDIGLTAPLDEALDYEASRNWIQVYLKNIKNPTKEDIVIFLEMDPSPEEAVEFLDRFIPKIEDFKYFKFVDLKPEYMQMLFNRMSIEERNFIRKNIL